MAMKAHGRVETVAVLFCLQCSLGEGIRADAKQPPASVTPDNGR